MESWILSRLSLAVDRCKTGFTSYDFQTATSACYNFWLYELCDWYLVSLSKDVLIFSQVNCFFTQPMIMVLHPGKTQMHLHL